MFATELWKRSTTALRLLYSFIILGWDGDLSFHYFRLRLWTDPLSLDPVTPFWKACLNWPYFLSNYSMVFNGYLEKRFFSKVIVKNLLFSKCTTKRHDTKLLSTEVSPIFLVIYKSNFFRFSFFRILILFQSYSWGQWGDKMSSACF